MIRTISFDLDHTLYDRNATWDNCFLKFISTFSTYINLEMTEKRILELLKKADRNATYEETSWNGMYGELLNEHVLSEQVTYSGFYEFIYQYFPDAVVPYADTYKTLTWCRKEGYRPSIITNGHPKLQERKIDSMKLVSYVDECIICNLDSGTGCKPEPEPFLKLAELMKVHPSEILYVGDNPINDIQGARNAGMRTAWLNIMDNWIPGIEPADYEISTLYELQRIMKNIHD